MRLRSRVVWLSVVAVGLGWAALVGAADEAPRVVLLIGWDGAQRGHLQEMIGRNEVPNLSALTKEGALVDVDVTSGATDTKAGWTQILTGYKPAVTGVYSNGRYRPIPVGFTLLERLETHFGKDNIYTAAIVGKKGHVDADAPEKVPFEQWQRRQAAQGKVNKAAPGLGDLQDGQVVEENGKKYVLLNGKPYYNMKDRIDLWVNGLSANERVGERAMAEIEQHKAERMCLFIHFAEPDHAGHKHGENSQEYTNAIRSDDEWTGKIIGKLKQLGLYDKALVYVVVDHGFNEGQKGHSKAPFVFLGTNDKQVTRNGSREDITPTVLKRFGVDLAKIEPRLDGIPYDETAPVRVADKAASKRGKAGAAKGGAAKGGKAKAGAAKGGAAKGGKAKAGAAKGGAAKGGRAKAGAGKGGAAKARRAGRAGPRAR